MKPIDLDITFIFLSAGISQRMKSYEPRSLIKINGKTLMEHQSEEIYKYFESPDIIYVSGYKTDKVKKRANKLGVNVIENTEYETTNCSKSIQLALPSAAKSSGVLLFHGDLAFDINFYRFFPLLFNQSFVLIDNSGQIKDREIGVNVTNSKINTFSYGLKTKWCQIAYLQGEELEMLKKYCNKSFELTHEILNKIVDNGGNIMAMEDTSIKICEIDSIGDVNENIDI